MRRVNPADGNWIGCADVLGLGKGNDRIPFWGKERDSFCTYETTWQYLTEQDLMSVAAWAGVELYLSPEERLTPARRTEQQKIRILAIVFATASVVTTREGRILCLIEDRPSAKFEKTGAPI